MIRYLVPLFQRSGVKAVFSGHEHNFQYSHVAGIHYFISGAGGKVRLAPPTDFTAAQTACWASAGNFLLVEVSPQQMVITPLAALSETGELTELVTFDPNNQPGTMPIVINRV